MTAKKRTKNDPLSMKETIEFEKYTGESVEDFWDKAEREGRPRMYLLATMAWIKVRREEEGLSYEDYIDRSSIEDVLKDIGGDEDTEEGKKESTSSSTKQRGRPSSASQQD